METANVKKIYKQREALVSDELMNSSDAEIDAAIYAAEPGMIIYTAGRGIVKQRGLDGRWVRMSTSNGGNNSGSSGGSGSGNLDDYIDSNSASKEEVDGMLDDVFK